MSLKDRIIEWLVEIKIRLDTAAGSLNWVKNLIIMTAGFKYIVSLSRTETIFLGVTLMIFMYLIGWLALDIIKFPQVEAALRDGKYNNFMKKVGEKILNTRTR